MTSGLIEVVMIFYVRAKTIYKAILLDILGLLKILLKYFVLGEGRVFVLGQVYGAKVSQLCALSLHAKSIYCLSILMAKRGYLAFTIGLGCVFSVLLITRISSPRFKCNSATVL